nr:metallophosphoesterase [Paenibacillus cremeus]
MLIFGGDQVYPTASRQEYERRLVTPYHLASGFTEEQQPPQVFAIPGNHDWYDGLIAFTRLFCSSRWFNGWQTKHRKSYFALKLPHGWWVLGADVQLQSDIDDPQVNYFKQVISHMQAGDRVMLCNAEPYWVTTEKYRETDPTFAEKNLAFLERLVQAQEARIQVSIAGDLHHYRRFEHIPASDDERVSESLKVEKITAGGGGAFLHPTHEFTTEALYDNSSEADSPIHKTREFKRMQDYPRVHDSSRLCWRNLLVRGTISGLAA